MAKLTRLIDRKILLLPVTLSERSEGTVSHQFWSATRLDGMSFESFTPAEFDIKIENRIHWNRIPLGDPYRKGSLIHLMLPVVQTAEFVEFIIRPSEPGVFQIQLWTTSVV